MIIKYKNNKIERICSLENEMIDFFSNDMTLVKNFKRLLSFINQMDNIYQFKGLAYKGYNLEKLVAKGEMWSLRIIPKKRVSSYRLLFKIIDKGIEIEILEISNHYK